MPSAIEGCTQLALSGGAFLARPFATASDAETDLERRERRFSASRDGFDVHCAVRIEAEDDEGRERLLRYCARPPISLERLSVLPDGRVAYLLKSPRKGRTHRVMTPVEFLARLAALVAPPRYPLLRYHGVLAPRSSWRRAVAPKLPRPKTKPRCAESGSNGARRTDADGATQAPLSGASATPPGAQRPSPQTSSAPAADVAPPRSPPAAPVAPSTLALAPGAEVDVAPMTLTVRHWGRLRDGELLASSPRIEWPRLMQRTLGFDVLSCPKCSGRMRVLSVIDEPAVVKRILDHLGLPTEPPPLAPARASPMDQVGFGFEVA
jgi:Putative transposase